MELVIISAGLLQVVLFVAGVLVGQSLSARGGAHLADSLPLQRSSSTPYDQEAPVLSWDEVYAYLGRADGGRA